MSDQAHTVPLGFVFPARGLIGILVGLLCLLALLTALAAFSGGMDPAAGHGLGSWRWSALLMAA